MEGSDGVVVRTERDAVDVRQRDAVLRMEGALVEEQQRVGADDEELRRDLAVAPVDLVDDVGEVQLLRRVARSLQPLLVLAQTHVVGQERVSDTAKIREESTTIFGFLSVLILLELTFGDSTPSSL